MYILTVCEYIFEMWSSRFIYIFLGFHIHLIQTPKLHILYNIMLALV